MREKPTGDFIVYRRDNNEVVGYITAYSLLEAIYKAESKWSEIPLNKLKIELNGVYHY
jgi:CBS domain containing-hemolysin-like protein